MNQWFIQNSLCEFTTEQQCANKQCVRPHEEIKHITIIIHAMVQLTVLNFQI